jgi:hypothetical protein
MRPVLSRLSRRRLGHGAQGDGLEIDRPGCGAGYYKEVALAKRRVGVRWLKARSGGG